MGNLTGFQRCLLPHSNPSKVKKVSEILPKRSDLSVHCPSFWFGHSSLGVYKGGQGSEAHSTGQGYLDDWLLRAPCQVTCQQHTQTLLALCRELGLEVNMKKSELNPQQVFNFIGYWFNLLTSQVLPTQDWWRALQKKLSFIKNRNSCTDRQFMSLIGLLTATEKQVWLCRLHVRPIQWHLKRHWHIPEIL